MTANLAQLRHRITAAVQEVTQHMLQRVWQEIDFRWDAIYYSTTSTSKKLEMVPAEIGTRVCNHYNASREPKPGVIVMIEEEQASITAMASKERAIHWPPNHQSYSSHYLCGSLFHQLATRGRTILGIKSDDVTQRGSRESWQQCSREKLFPWFAFAPAYTEKSMLEPACLPTNQSKNIHAPDADNSPQRLAPPDLTPRDFWMWVYFKDKVYQGNIRTCADLKRSISREISRIHIDKLLSYLQNSILRFQTLVGTNGRHIESLL
ncbi:hypothetical protein C0J52_01516 [Blattella germanica]|nr:hypothetical protein C0J52_01516 [Blattella germanica]